MEKSPNVKIDVFMTKVSCGLSFHTVHDTM